MARFSAPWAAAWRNRQAGWRPAGCNHGGTIYTRRSVSKDTLSLAAALLTMLFWGINFSMVKYVLEQLGVSAFLFLRFLALPVLGFLLLVAIFRSRVRYTWPRREDLPRFVASALVGHTIHIAVVMYAMNLSTAFSSSIVLTSGPLFTLMILVALKVERLRAAQVVGTLVACAGISIFLADKFAGGFSRAGYGDLLLIVAAFLFSLYTVLVQPLAQRYGPLIVLCYTLLFGAPLILLFTWSAVATLDFRALAPMVWVGLVWTIVFSSLFGWLMWTWVNTVRGVARSAPFAYLCPPISGVIAWLTLGESFTWLKIAGAVITMAGVAWAQFGGGASPRKETAQPDTP
jgi:drug/metabolite transporter (DMT)-like permease